MPSEQDNCSVVSALEVAVKAESSAVKLKDLLNLPHQIRQESWSRGKFSFAELGTESVMKDSDISAKKPGMLSNEKGSSSPKLHRGADLSTVDKKASVTPAVSLFNVEPHNGSIRVNARMSLQHTQPKLDMSFFQPKVSCIKKVPPDIKNFDISLESCREPGIVDVVNRPLVQKIIGHTKVVNEDLRTPMTVFDLAGSIYIMPTLY